MPGLYIIQFMISHCENQRHSRNFCSQITDQPQADIRVCGIPVHHISVQDNKIRPLLTDLIQQCYIIISKLMIVQVGQKNNAKWRVYFAALYPVPGDRQKIVGYPNTDAAGSGCQSQKDHYTCKDSMFHSASVRYHR